MLIAEIARPDGTERSCRFGSASDTDFVFLNVGYRVGTEKIAPLISSSHSVSIFYFFDHRTTSLMDLQIVQTRHITKAGEAVGVIALHPPYYTSFFCSCGILYWVFCWHFVAAAVYSFVVFVVTSFSVSQFQPLCPMWSALSIVSV